MQPVVLHVDMNSYFASVAQQDNLAWRGKPVGVCEHLGGIIIAASVEAKKWGITTGTPVWEARRLYPKIILTKTAPDRYRLYTSRLIKVVSDYTSFVEKYSIDECFLDVSRVCNVRNVKLGINNLKSTARVAKTVHGLGNMANPFFEAVKISLEIKRRVKAEVGDYLTCSIGVAENKLLAKIASDMQKPDGLVVIGSELGINNYKLGNALFFTKDNLYHKLKLTDIPGIGKRQAVRLNSIGIRTLMDLKNYPLSHLVASFGILGYHLHQMGQLKGSWKPRVEEDEKIKSIGHMYTLPMQFRKPEFFVPVLYKLCEMVGQRLRGQKLMGNILHFFTHDKNYEGFGQSKKLGYFLWDGREIFLEAARLFEAAENNLAGQAREYKIIGVTVAGLGPVVNQLSLFERDERAKRAVLALDKINEKYGDFTVCRVPILAARDAFHDSVGFGRMKEFKSWKVKNK